MSSHVHRMHRSSFTGLGFHLLLHCLLHLLGLLLLPNYLLHLLPHYLLHLLDLRLLPHRLLGPLLLYHHHKRSTIIQI